MTKVPWPISVVQLPISVVKFLLGFIAAAAKGALPIARERLRSPAPAR